MQGIFFLSIILSFVSYSPIFLNYIQLFNIILLLGVFVLVKQHNIIFISTIFLYIFLFLIVIRLKLYNLAYITRKSKTYYTNSILVAFFLLVVLISWVFSVNIRFERIRIRGIFLDEEFRGDDSEGTQKETFWLQDEVQKEVTNWIFTLSTIEEKRSALLLLSSLLQDWPYADQGNNAESSLINTLESEVSELDTGKKKEQLVQMIGKYIDKKIASRLKQISDDMTGILRDQHVRIMDRISVLNRIDRINSSGSHQGISRLGDELQNIISKAYTSDNTRKQLREIARQFREWKSYQIYHKQLGVTKEKINALDSNKKSTLKDIVEQINKTDRKSELLKIENKLNSISKESNSEEKEALNNINEIMGLKTEMVTMKESSEFEKRLDNAGLARDKLKEFEGAVNALNEVDKPRQLLKTTSQLIDTIYNDETLRTSGEVKEILEAKLDYFIKKTKEKIKKKIQENNLPDSGKQLISDIEKMDLAQENDKLSGYVRSSNKEIDKFFREGFLSKESRDNLIQDIIDLEQLLKRRLEVKTLAQKERSAEKTPKIDYQRDVSKLLQSTTLEDEQRETLDNLMERLNAAQTISQVEDVLEALEKEINSSAKRWSKEEAEKVKELLRKIAEAKKKMLIEENNYNLRKKIEELESERPKQAMAMEEKLEKLKTSRTDKEYRENMESLEKELGSEQKKEDQLNVTEGALPGTQEVPRGKRTDPLRIYLLPPRVILPLGTRISFKNIAVYNKGLIKDISSELEWFSSDPSIAFVDDKGIVRALTKGTTEVFVRHKGSTSEKAEVTVVDNILDDVRREVENKLP
jgi:DNA repair exonuclease SbcCD ATPase subunit